MKKNRFIHIAMTLVMLLSTVITPQMSHALASFQDDGTNDTTEVEENEVVKQEGADEISDPDGDDDGAQVENLGEQADTEGETEGIPSSDGNDEGSEPKDLNANSPPMSLFNFGILSEPISENLVTGFEMIINPGANQIVVKDKDNLEVDLDEMNALTLTYTLVKPNDVLVNPGDIYRIDLPSFFDQTLTDPQPINIGEVTVGTYIIEGGQIVITFNEEVEDHDDIAMNVNISGSFNTTVFEKETEVVVNVPFLDRTVFEVVVRPEQKEYVGEDKKTAGYQYVLDGENKIEVTRNPEYIDWTVRANDNMGTFQNATIIDDLGNHLEIVADSFVVERIIRNYNNEEIRRENVPVTPEMLEITSSGFELDLGDIEDAYDIKYTTRIMRPDGGGTHTINNDAHIILGTNEKEVSDDFTGTWSGDIPTIDKDGAISDDRKDVIDWKVKYNFSKEQLGTVDLTDTLSHGEVIEDSINVYQVETDIDGNIVSQTLLDGVEPVIEGNVFTIPNLDANGKAYYIEFSSIVPVGINDTVINTVSDNLDPNPNEDDASVPVNTIPTGGKVGEQDVDEEGNPYIEWTITMNSQRVNVGSINIIDVFDPIYLEFDVEDNTLYKLYQDGVEVDNFDLDYYEHEIDGIKDGRTGFELTVNNAGPHEYKFVYRTYYTVEGMQEPELANNAELIFRDYPSEGGGIGEGEIIGDPIDVNFDLEGPKAGIEKSGRYIRTENNAEQQIEWTVTFNQSKIMLNAANTSIDDIFTSGNIAYIPGSIKIVDENNVEFTNYDFEGKTFDINIGTEENPEIVSRNGFTIQLTENTNKTLTVTYLTTTDDSNQTNDVHKNEATLNWQGGSETDDAEVGVRHPGINKTGTVVNNEDGTKTVNWTINFNTNTNIVHDFELVDTYTPTTVTISNIKITNGETDVTGQFTISPERTGGTLTVTKKRLDAVSYQLTYSTTLSAGEEKDDLVNTANIAYTGGTGEASRTITKPTLGVLKEAVGRVDKTESGDFINWKITANTDTTNHLVNLVNPVLTDTIPSDQKLVPGTIEVIRLSDNEDITELLTMTEGTNAFSISLPNGAYQYVVTFQTEILEYPSAHETRLDRYTNETTLSNDDYDPVSDDAYIDYFADGTNNNNTKEGVVNNDTENIDWTATVNPLGLTIKNAKIVDKLSGNQTYLINDSYDIVVIAEGETLVEGEENDYTLTMDEDNRGFTITFKDTINQPITISYFTRLDPELIGNVKVSNNLKLFGGEGDKELSSVTTEENTSQWTFGGGGSGRTLEFTLNKRSPSGEGVPNATFLFERYSTSGTLLANGKMEITTGADGTFEVVGARAGRYKVTEASTPEGYVLLSDPIYMTIGYAKPSDLGPDDSPYTIQINNENWGNVNDSEIAQASGDQLTIVNEHKSVAVSLEAQKTLEGNKELEAGAFTFELVKLADSEESDDEVIQTKTNNADGEIVFDAIPYNTTGTFEYAIREVEGSLDGVTYDKTPQPVTVTVTSGENGVLSASISYGENIPTFENTYLANPVSVDLEARKVLDGQDLRDEHFEFELVDTDDNVVETVTNDVDGNINFAAIEYTKIGEYTYTIREVNSSLGGINYDDSEFEVTVTVTDDGEGELAATVSYPGDEIPQFTNSYEAASGSIVLQAQKILDGREIKSGEFDFVLVDSDDNVVERVSNDADGTISFAAIEYTETGEYIYTIQEVTGDLGGVEYDTTTRNVTVTVRDNGEGQLVAEADYEDDEAIFTNIYTTEPVKAEIRGGKILKGLALKEGQYEFELLNEEGEVIQSKVNLENGEFIFDEIEYDEAGTYSYTIREVKGNLDYIVYDETTFSVDVVITDNGVGQLVSEVNYVNGPAVFENEYKPFSASVIFEAEKILEGQELKDNQFRFELVNESGEVISETRNSRNGKIIFDELLFEKAGNYSFLIREVNEGIEGYTYDNVSYKVSVEVTDNGEGQLFATVEYVDGSPVFENTYVEPEDPEELPLLPINPGDETSGGSKGDKPLPQTGEAPAHTALALVLIGLGLVLFIYRRRFSNEKK